MTEWLAKGTWVEIQAVILPAGSRAPEVPDDTACVPLQMRAKGGLAKASKIGAEAEIVTVTGRCLHGTVIAANPPYDHSFGAPLPELIGIGGEVRALLRERGQDE